MCMRYVLLFILLLSLPFAAVSQRDIESDFIAQASVPDKGHKELKAIRNAFRIVFQHRSNAPALQSATIQDLPTEDARAVAITLTIALGVFGAHRIYLGTTDYVPLFYTLTIGGGLGILPAIDLIHLCLIKDIQPYYNNDRLVMWGGN